MKTAHYDINAYYSEACGEWMKRILEVFNEEREHELDATMRVEFDRCYTKVTFIVDYATDEDIKPIQDAWMQLFGAQHS